MTDIMQYSAKAVVRYINGDVKLTEGKAAIVYEAWGR